MKPFWGRRNWDFTLCKGHKCLSLSQNTFCNKEHIHFALHVTSTCLSFCVSQVWYLSGWVCYLQWEKAKEQQEAEGREVTGEEKEEWEALQEAARSYLTNAKKVSLVKVTLKHSHGFTFISIVIKARTVGKNNNRICKLSNLKRFNVISWAFFLTFCLWRTSFTFYNLKNWWLPNIFAPLYIYIYFCLLYIYQS